MTERVNDKDKNKIVANPMPLNYSTINNGQKLRTQTPAMHMPS